ncbi:hypothetical protein SOM11_09970 [Frigoribacterium sp. CFBP9039]|uniref:hypothetical protein n=1 Tax=Frigoribacterium sp. CFBP9029 TaxID=3096541 RepID=UPI002A69D46B|nr:hypothetical protein [Frigoribacterium sp. CFBP9039]MDY0946308.1 hypothetical protein [Frigoribacterium sp. CFBP9039]
MSDSGQGMQVAVRACSSIGRVRPRGRLVRCRATQESELIDPAASAQERLGLSPRSVERWLVDLQS